MSTCTVDESYRYCNRLAKAKARNFYYGFMLLSRERRLALSAIYAFFRACDDIADGAEGGEEGPAEGRRAALEEWRRQMQGALDGEDSSGSPVFPAFRDAVQRFGIPAVYFHDLLDGAIMDLDVHTYDTFEDLYRYCYRVASTVGQVCTHVFGFDGSRTALKLAEWCGIAFQLTNILRDIEEDARVGRVYLPQEDLRRFGLSAEDLTAARANDAFYALMRFQAQRARDYYARSADLARHIYPVSRPALRAMVDIYHGLLDKIERENFQIFGRRVRLSKGEKLGLLARAYFSRNTAALR